MMTGEVLTPGFCFVSAVNGQLGRICNGPGWLRQRQKKTNTDKNFYL
jgi:hypothetical protein